MTSQRELGHRYGASGYTNIQGPNDHMLDPLRPLFDVEGDISKETSSSGAKRKNGKKQKSRLETPKVAFGQNRARAFRHFLLFHAIPLAGALALIILNFRGRFLGSIGGSWISSLQFVAKAHEMLMQASVGMVMLAYVQYLLIHKRNIPFGAIFSYYQLSQLNYLWSPEFYAVLTTPTFDGLLRKGFILFIPFSILLATAVGPSSAIAMQPRFVNFTVPNYALAYNVTSDALYPQSLLNPNPRQMLSSVDSVSGPSSEWENLQRLPTVDGELGSFTGWQDQQVPIGSGSSVQVRVMPPLFNIEMANDETGPRQMYLQYAPNSTFATIQHVPVAAALTVASGYFTGLLSELVSNRPGSATASIEMPQPVVSVLCKLNSILSETDARPIQFPDTYVAGCGVDESCLVGLFPPPLNKNWSTTDYTAISRSQIWNQAKSTGEGRIIWVDKVNITGPVGSGLGAIVVQPEFCQTAKNTTFLAVSACVVGGVWSNKTTMARADFNGASDTHATPQSSVDTTTFGNMSEWSRPPVKLSKEWAEGLNPLTNIQNRTVVNNLLRWMPVTKNVCPLSGSFVLPTEDGTYPEDQDNLSFSDTRPFMHEALLASLVANGMSHVSDNVERWYWLPEKWAVHGWTHSDSRTSKQVSQPNPPGVVLSFNGHLLGYAFTLDGIPIKIALPILIVYCLYTLSYVLYTFITGRSSRVWSTMSGFTALAINSTPTEALVHTSAGIQHTNTFRHALSVREVESHDGLEIVFEHDERKSGAYKRVVVGRGY